MERKNDKIAKYLSTYVVAKHESALIADPERIFPYFPIGRRHNIPEDRFLDWVKAADYETAAPHWWSQYSKMLYKKIFEHYASIELVNMSPGGTYLEAASCASPFYRVIRDTHDVAMCYRQDLTHIAGVRGDTIGSDAGAIPLPDAGLDGIVTHNSWEHFEGDSAIGFIRECARLLKPGRKFCIIPLIFREQTEIWTSPSCWLTKYVNAPDFPIFDRRAAIVIKEEIVQRQIMWWKPAELANELSKISELEFEVVYVECGQLNMYSLVGARR